MRQASALTHERGHASLQIVTSDLPILAGKGFSLKLKGKVYATCVRSCLMHGSETWPMKVEHELKLNRPEMTMIRRICGINLNERKKSE